ncbi:cobalamin-dependent protein, partial [bacterium]|nr:cobalamin-dependent protein [bacterium]
MKIVLIRPQFVNKKISFFAYRDPTALAGICSYLQSKEYDVSLWDYQDIDYDNYGFKHAVLTCCPAVVGFSCLTPNILIANDMARIVKSINPEIVTVVGGCHSTAIPMQTLKECLYFDIAIIGEGEITFEELCKKIQNHENYKNMAGIAYRDKDKIVINPSRELIKDIDILPYPARYLYQDNKKRYQHFGRGISHDIHVTDIFTARGCPNKCTFCAGNLSMKNSGISYRQHSVSYVLGEVEECIKRYY